MPMAKQGAMRIRLRRPTVTQALVGVFLPLVSGTGLLVAWIDAQLTYKVPAIIFV